MITEGKDAFIACLSFGEYWRKTRGMTGFAMPSQFHRGSILPLLLIWALIAFPENHYAAEADDLVELPVLRRSFAEPSSPIPPFPDGRFELRNEETVAWLGGTEILDLDRDGILEAGLELAWPMAKIHWRNLAWAGDTIYYQARPRNYYTKKGDSQPGSIPDHREKAIPGIIFLSFGKMESLEDEARLPEFVQAYQQVLDDLKTLTPRLVLIEPTPFLASGPAADRAKERNVMLRKYWEAIATVARQQGFLTMELPRDIFSPAHSLNGIHLNEEGHRVFARVILQALGAPHVSENTANPSSELLAAIQAKNRLWHQYYQPTNWAFLFGDRQHVPASRDPEKREERWFVREIDSLPALIKKGEEDVFRLVSTSKK